LEGSVELVQQFVAALGLAEHGASFRSRVHRFESCQGRQ
jgi:hypothetical protein